VRGERPRLAPLDPVSGSACGPCFAWFVATAAPRSHHRAALVMAGHFLTSAEASGRCELVLDVGGCPG